MQLPNFNTIAMGFLFTIFVVLGLGFVTELIFHTPAPETPGYKIEVADTAGTQAPAEEAAKEEPIATLLASADIGAGEKTLKKCVACHSFDEGGANKVGPHLYDVLGRSIAAVGDFNYSGAMKEYAAGKQWTYDELNGFLTKPSDWIKGTAMGFAGLKNAQERANLIAYIRTLSGAPQPLPAN